MAAKKLVQLNVRVTSKLKKQFDRTLKERGHMRDSIVGDMLEHYINHGRIHETETS